MNKIQGKLDNTTHILSEIRANETAAIQSMTDSAIGFLRGKIRAVQTAYFPDLAQQALQIDSVKWGN